MQKQQVLYIHGGEAFSKYENYLELLRTKPIRDLPWDEPSQKWPHTLRGSLGEQYEVFMPNMPCSGNAKYAEWKIWFERHFEYVRDGLILIGWSQGGYFLVKYLLENDMPVQVAALILLAAPFETEDFGGEDGGDFAFDTNKVGELAKKVGEIHILHSEDDFVVPYAHALKYKAALPEATLHTFTDKNHFLVPELPELLTVVRTIHS